MGQFFGKDLVFRVAVYYIKFYCYNHIEEFYMLLFNKTGAKVLFRLFFLILIFVWLISCTSTSMLINHPGWEEIDNIDLEYDMEEYNSTNMLSTNRESTLLINRFLDEYLSNAYQVKISQEVYLDNNREHKLVVSRRWTGSSSVKYFIYRLQIIYRNCTINYEFINDGRNGAMWEGDDLGFIKYVNNEDVRKFRQDINSVMRIIYNNLIKSNDPMVIGQANAIKYRLDNFRTVYFIEWYKYSDEDDDNILEDDAEIGIENDL